MRLLSMPTYVVPASATLMSSSATGLLDENERVAERRRRGEISCAECRRLKMRCDRNIPCKPCIRRGCGYLCPNGTRLTADGPRLVLAATNHLHEEIAMLRDRIRCLEGALGSIHRHRTGQTHSLLAPLPDEDWEDDDPIELDTVSNLNDQKISGDHGKLEAGQDGADRLFGSVGGEIMHIMSMTEREPGRFPIGAPSSRYDVELTRCIRNFPFIPSPPPDISRIIKLLRLELPDMVTCETLIDIALAEVGVTLMAFTSDYVENTIVPIAFFAEGTRALHALISLFALIAIGALLAVPGPGEVPEVNHYGRLAAVAIGASTPTVVNTIELIQGIYALNILEFMRQGCMEEVSRSAIAMACKMCYNIGLHIDASKWDVFTDEDIRHRRAVFWMLFKTDAWESLVIGRPPAMPLYAVDIELPNITTKPTDPLDNLIRAIASATLVNSEVVLATQSLNPPTYTQILRLDEKVMSKHPKSSQTHISATPPPSLIRIFLHRAFFARALTDHPHDLLRSEYAASVLATIRGAHETLSWLAELLKARPGISSRTFHVWSMGYVAATVYATLLERAPRCPQAQDAQSKVEHAISLFTIGAQYGSGRAKHSLAVLRARLAKISKTDDSHPLDAVRSDPSRRRTESPWISSSKNQFLFPPSREPSPPPSNRKHALTRAVSLPHISDYAARPKQPSLSSAAGKSFYPSYLQSRTREGKVLAQGAGKPEEDSDLGPSVPISRTRTRPVPPEFTYYRSSNNAALWDGAGWDAMQHATQTKSELGMTMGGMPIPRASLAGEWNMINFGGGQDGGLT